ncbi:GyrI-like domain-containing protein [Limosilactobacillus viscerum]|uniref:GyrI-like domain-containing protein n=1 Tax=Limosilactobacillus viscerum TaxID=2993450 RepID=UPI0024BBA8A1|nr:GyrI-like domain-containing protein [Limosilactobacillus viscerum]
MAYNFKKEQKDLYNPGKRPMVIDVPAMNYLAVRGHGDPNAADSEYQQSIPLLYAVAYTIKMSKKGDHQIPGYFDFVVPPLEGYWWQEGVKGIDYDHKEKFSFISMIRMPDFVDQATFEWAVKEASVKKRLDLAKVEFLSQHEGLCVQALHVGPYDDEPATVKKLHELMADKGLQLDINDHRHHHEIYLSDPRRSQPEKLRTIIRIPVKK